MNVIFKNSYVVSVLFFTVFCLFCYIFKFCYSFKYENRKIVQNLNFKYPIAFTLIIWLIWNFLLFPNSDAWISDNNEQYKTNLKKFMKNNTNNIQLQKINLEIWK